MSTWPLWQKAGFLVGLLATLALGQGLRSVWQTQLVERGIGGDGLHYWHMAAHIEREHAISLDGKKLVWTRLPGYPAWLALTTSPAISDEGPMDPESIRVRVQAWMRRQTRVDLEADLACAVGACLLALGFGAGPLALVAALLWAVQPWSSVISIHPLSDGLATLVTAFALYALVRGLRTARAFDFAISGALCGLCLWVRADAVLLLPPLVLGAFVAPPGPLWPPKSLLWSFGARLRLVAAALLAVVVVFAPWSIRNLIRFGEAHPLGGGGGIDKYGEPLDRSAAFEWMRTFCDGSEAHSVGVTWRFPSQPFGIADVPPEAMDSPAERAEVAAILAEYNRRGARLDEDLGMRLRAVARAHCGRHPFDCYLRVPFLRIGRRLMPPRDGYGMGSLPTLRNHPTPWQVSDGVVVVLGLLGLLALVRVPDTRRIGLVVGAWFVLRLLMIGAVPASEPRYFLEAMPLLVAACASLPRSLALVRANRANRANWKNRKNDARRDAPEAADRA